MESADVREREKSLKKGKAWRVLYGILFILLGTLFMVVAAFLSSEFFGSGRMKLPPDFPFVLFGFFFGLIALVPGAGNIWLGIGMLRARRWARAVAVALSWIAILGMLMSIPMQLFQRSVSPEPATAKGVVSTGIVLVLILAFNLFAALYFGRDANRERFEVLDPVKRWTDGRSVTTLGLFLVLGPASALMLLFSLAVVFTIPMSVLSLFGSAMFGMVVSARFLVAGMVLMAGLALIVSWRFWELDLLGWRMVAALVLLGLLNNVLNLAVLGEAGLYGALFQGFPEPQKQQMVMSLPSSPVWLLYYNAVAYPAVMGAFLYKVRREFFPPKTTQA